jgi:hypothetical protein
MSSQIVIHLMQRLSGIIRSRRNTGENYNVTGVLIENLGQETDGLWDICTEILLFATKQSPVYCMLGDHSLYVIRYKWMLITHLHVLLKC